MDLKLTAYIHGMDSNNISNINLIFLLNAKTIGTVEFRSDNCSIAVYGDNKQQKLEMMNEKALCHIFGRYINSRLNEFGEIEFSGNNFLPKVLQYIKNSKIEYNFLKLSEISETLFPKNDLNISNRR